MSNPQCENGYTKIANELLSALCRIRINGEATQILYVIFRKTYGYNKKRDRISLSQFCLLTGLKKPNVCRAIKKLIAMKLIIKIDNTKGEIYLIQKDFDQWKPLSKKITLSKKIMGVIKKDNASLSKKIHTKDNTTKDNITKEIISKEITYGNPQINECISFLKEKLGGSPDGSIAENRRFCKLLLNRLKKDYPEQDHVNQIRFLIEASVIDPFHAKNATSFKYIFYNAQKIISSVKNKKGATII